MPKTSQYFLRRCSSKFEQLDIPDSVYDGTMFEDSRLDCSNVSILSTFPRLDYTLPDVIRNNDHKCYVYALPETPESVKAAVYEEEMDEQDQMDEHENDEHSFYADLLPRRRSSLPRVVFQGVECREKDKSEFLGSDLSSFHFDVGCLETRSKFRGYGRSIKSVSSNLWKKGKYVTKFLKKRCFKRL